ncbi:MAG: TetR/AcrR family transcriptional regulator [Thermoleophilaceae bacterium]
MREEGGTGSRRRLTKDERRARILDAAAEVFASRGYEGTSIDEVAEAAGISKPVIYDHFDSKKDLHIALIDKQTEDMLSFWSERVSSEQSLDRQLAAGFDAFLEFVETHEYAWRLLFRDPTAADADILKAQARIQHRATAAIAAVGQANVDESVPKPEVEVVAQMVKTAANGVAAWWYEHRDIPRSTLVDIMVSFAWLGLERLTAGDRWRREEN